MRIKTIQKVFTDTILVIAIDSFFVEQIEEHVIYLSQYGFM